MRLEPMTRAQVTCHTNATARIDGLVRSEMAQAVGHLQPRHIVIKPNWVLHETDPRHPITALVTDARVIAATARAAAELFPAARITVGDCPLQRADWPLLCRQSGLAGAIAEIERAYGGRVSFRDLRKEVYAYEAGRLVQKSGAPPGDPLGYREITLGSSSHLEEISDRADRFAIHDHDRAKTRGNHQRGDHRYFVSQSCLDADLLINLPKWKTHSKSGLTGALKNLVGINGDKAYLPHFSRGAPSWGGDEYWDRGRWMYWTQNTLRDLLRTRWWPAYRAVRPIWLAFKALRRTMLRDDEGPPPDFYVGGGSWHGNQTIWRMIYDLNLVVQCVDAAGVLHAEPQRHYFCIVDGLVCGEGDGPLFPQPRDMGWLAFGTDPFAVDAALAWFMGFNPARLPVVARRDRYLGPQWGDFDLERLSISLDGSVAPLTTFPVQHHFVPPPGWIGHVEQQTAIAAGRGVAAYS
jgi:uncharacterized protein (DUF362 family)